MTSENAESSCNTEVDLLTGSIAYKARRMLKDLQRNNFSVSLMFESLADESKNLLLAQVNRREDETAVFATFENRGNWVFATSHRLVWSTSGSVHDLAYSKIKEVNFLEMDEFLSSQFDDNDMTPEVLEERSQRIRSIKETSPWLSITDMDGNSYRASVPPGPILFALWNAILLRVRLEKIHPTPDS